jgi:hypothetical protein
MKFLMLFNRLVSFSSELVIFESNVKVSEFDGSSIEGKFDANIKLNMPARKRKEPLRIINIEIIVIPSGLLIFIYSSYLFINIYCMI